MTIIPILQNAWASLWVLRRQHDVPFVARMFVAALTGTALTLVLMAIVAVFGMVQRPNWWWASILPNIAICVCIAVTLLLTVRTAELLLPPALVERMSVFADLRAGVCLGAIGMFGVILGMTLGFTVVPALVGSRASDHFISLPAALTKFAVFLLFLFIANGMLWRSRLRRKALQQQAAEAQLRLLQGQIEPHFLFNTLANVQSLMDYEPARAKAMLEAFSDYLRAGLTQLRQTDSTVGAELAMSASYLELLQIRMEDRLHFSIDADALARAVSLPTLLLQPLVENAIHHGLEPKVEGGTVRISAHLRDGCLTLRVRDDGLGLEAPRRPLRAGSGMAIANLRARLAARYGSAATLTLMPLEQGTEAVLSIPCTGGA